MGKPINSPQEIPDLPDGLSIGSIDSPQPAKGRQAGAQNAQAVYTPSEFTVKALDKLPKEEIKATTGIDIDYLKANVKTSGVLEAIASGDWTPYPVPALIRGKKATVTARIYGTRDGKWDCELHSVNMKFAVDANGNYLTGPDGKYKIEYDRNKLKKGDVIMYDGAPLSPEEMDHLRLTGHLGDVKRGVNGRTGEETTVLVSVDPWNEHELCRTTGKAVRARLFPALWTKDATGRLVVLRAQGCIRPESGVVSTAFTVTTADGTPVKVAGYSGNTVKIPVNGPCNLRVKSADGTDTTINLSSAQVGRLSPSVSFFTTDQKRIISYLTAKQLGEIAIGKEVWVGGKDSMSFIISGTKNDLTLTPVTEKGYAACVHYDAARSKVVKGVDFGYAMRKELEMAEKASLERQMSMSESESKDIRVGHHIG